MGAGRIPIPFVIFLCFVYLAPFGLAPVYGEERPVLTNNDYLVIAMGNSVTALNTKTGEVIERTFEHPVGSLDLCPLCPFLYLEEKIAGTYMRDGEEARFNKEEEYLLDLEKGRLYHARELDDYEMGIKWSPDGRHAVFENPLVIAVVRTEHLRKYLQKPPESRVVEEEMLVGVISGMPEGGDILATAWAGRYLLYEASRNFASCYGAFDTGTGKNYLLSCCGIREFDDVDGCGEFGQLEADGQVALFLRRTREKSLVEISESIYDEVVRLIKDRRGATPEGKGTD